MAEKPTLSLTSVTISTARPRQLAQFYATLFDTEIATEELPQPGEPKTAGWAQLRTSNGMTINFEYEREFHRPIWPAEPGAQNATEHLDIQVSDLTTAVEWALECGAELSPEQFLDGVRVLFDPDGHPFCFFAH